MSIKTQTLNPATSTQDNFYQLFTLHYLVKFLRPCKMSPILQNPLGKKREDTENITSKVTLHQRRVKTAPTMCYLPKKYLQIAWNICKLEIFSIYYCIQKWKPQNNFLKIRQNTRWGDKVRFFIYFWCLSTTLYFNLHFLFMSQSM